MDKRLADLLVSSDLLTRAEVQRKILKSKALKSSVIEQMYDNGIDQDKLADVFCEYLNSKRIDESNFEINSTALKFLSKKMAEKNGVLPFKLSPDADRLSVAIFDPESSEKVMQTLKTATGNQPVVFIARKSWLVKAIRHYYFGDEWADKPTPKAQTFARLPKEERPVKLPPPNTNAIARVRPKRRTILTPVEMKLPMGQKQVVDSEEIILDEISFGADWQESDAEPTPKPKQAPRQEPRQEQRPTPKRRKSQIGTDASKKKTRPGSMVDQALNDFDAFLESQNGPPKQALVDPNLSDVPGWTSPPSEGGNSSFFGSWDSNEEKSAGFDLFSEAEELDENMTKYMEAQAKKITQLERDLERQQDVIQALIDILSERKVVSKRDIKKRITK